jgi:transposase-like protein
VASQVFSWWSLTTAVGLGKAIDALLPGAGWQRCRTHCMRNLLTPLSMTVQS